MEICHAINFLEQKLFIPYFILAFFFNEKISTTEKYGMEKIVQSRY